MNHLAALERQADGRWDFTRTNDGRTHPAGFCAGWRDYTPEDRARFGMSDAWWAKHLELKAHYHDDGHATAAEAVACYRSYLLETRLRLTGQYAGQQRRCQECGNWTTRFAEVDSESFPLCDLHRTRAVLERLFAGFTEAWES